jgi:hypothetical protein
VLLRNRGFDDEVVAAGLLHDLVEDTDATADDVRERFGDRVAQLVASLSDDPSIAAYEERKAALREQVADAGPDAQAIFAPTRCQGARAARRRPRATPPRSATPRSCATTRPAWRCSSARRPTTRSCASCASSCGPFGSFRPGLEHWVDELARWP